MDAPNSTPQQGKEEEQQATELPIVWEKAIHRKLLIKSVQW